MDMTASSQLVYLREELMDHGAGLMHPRGFSVYR